MSKLQMMGHDKKCCCGSLPEVNLLVLRVFFLLCENWHGVLVEKSHLCSCRQWGCGSNGTEELGSWWPWTQPNCPSGQPSSSNFMREQYIFLLIKSLLLDFCYYNQTNILTNHTVRIYVGVEMSLTCMGTEQRLLRVGKRVIKEEQVKAKRGPWLLESWWEEG